MKKLTIVFLTSLLGISAGISGCGQKGSLYIPDSENAVIEATEEEEGEGDSKKDEAAASIE